MPNLPLITTDSHVEVPLTLADELPDRFRVKVPHLEERADGVYLVRPLPGIADDDGNVDEGNMMTQALAAGIKVDPDDEAMLARIQFADVASEAEPGFTVEQRLKEMERDGVVGEVLIGTGSFGSLADADVATEWSSVMNDWLHDTYRDHYDKFAVGINLPLCDIDASVNELERAAGRGMGPGLLPACYPGRTYSQPMWEPLWEAAEGLGVPLVFHVGRRADGTGSDAQPAINPDRPARSHLTRCPFISAATVETVGSLVNSGVLARHPGLDVVMTETSAGWLAWLMEFSDHYYEARYSDADVGIRAVIGGSAPLTPEPPSFYMRRQVKCTFMYDPVAIRLRDVTGVDCLMWGNDYPHIEGV